MKLRHIILAGAVIVLASCSTSPKVTVIQKQDSALTCQQLRQEFDRLNDVEAEINSPRGSGNVVGLLFWLPAVAYSGADKQKALGLVQERRAHLSALYKRSNCDS